MSFSGSLLIWVWPAFVCPLGFTWDVINLCGCEVKRFISSVRVRGWGRERGPPYLVCWDKILLPSLKNMYSFLCIG